MDPLKTPSLTYTRFIEISTGGSRKAVEWKRIGMPLEEFYNLLQTPTVGIETLDEYMQLPKAQRDDLKDVGGFVGGILTGGRRKAGYVTGRDLITLDFDNIPGGGADNIISTVDAMQVGYVLYSTRKHRPEAPRLRIIFPLDRTVTADEYEPIARYMAEQIGIEMADRTTFEPERFMYWPSCCRDAEYIFQYADRPLASADAILGTYADWHDATSWPQAPGEDRQMHSGSRQADPDTKTGIVGAFNRACGGVVQAMDRFLPGVYEQCDTDPNRYTYTGGSTTGGALIYDNGKFLYSHHATDPAGGQLVNAFDLVRLHKFGDLDDRLKKDTSDNQLPSYLAMREFAAADPQTSALIIRERMELARADWEGLGRQDAPEEEEWIKGANLKMNSKTGLPLPTQFNVLQILRHNPALKDRIARNNFAGHVSVSGSLPWNPETKLRRWTDTDLNGLYMYMETAYDITKRTHIDSALDVYAAERAFNPLQDYLNGLKWDGKHRLDSLFVEYLGAEDSPYTRTVTRKIMVAAVARAMNPGCKFDNMLVLCGTQGRGKSSILYRLSKGWFNDTVLTFEGKEAAELIQGAWIVEIAELNAMNRSDVSRVKQFLSQQIDRYRPAYGRNVREVPRSCVFFGTVNEMDFLSDLTGNRRFWPLDVDVTPGGGDVWKDLTDDTIDQIWAEAVMRWRIGERLYLTPEEGEMAVRAQEAHRDSAPMEGQIEAFIDRQVPKDWEDWSVDRRRGFWAGMVGEGVELVDRTEICALEIQTELYHGDQRRKIRQIKAILRKILNERGGWTEKRKRYCNDYGTQRVFVKLDQSICGPRVCDNV